MGRRIRPCDITGVFLGAEAVAEGIVTKAQLRGPQFRRLFRGVYIPAGIPVAHREYCEGAALILPRTAAITGRSAATVRGVHLSSASDPVEIVVPLDVRVTRRAGIDLRRTEVEPAELAPWASIGITTPERMALDLLLDRPLVESVADLDAVARAGLVELPAFRQMLAKRHDNGIVQARQAAELSDPRAESLPESKVRVWLTLAGLEPIPQHQVFDSDGRFIARVDLAFPELKVAVEYEGRGHSDPHRLDPDRERLNRLRAAGWTIVFVTAAMLWNPRQVVAEVHKALRERVMEPQRGNWSVNSSAEVP